MYRSYLRSNNFKRNRYSRGYGVGFRKRKNLIDPTKFVNKATKMEEEKYLAKNDFQGLNINEQLKANILRKGFNVPMPIQDQAIPLILEGKDLIGIANTGMGKTLAFLIPLVNKMINNPNEKLLIITPTRELAQQIDSELYGITYRLNIWRVVCVGGTSIGFQIKNLARNHNVVIGTPGRLKDLAERKVLNLSIYNNIVLDEVDRMFDMGFAQDVKFLLDRTAKERQSLFFSATIDKRIEVLINQYSKNPVTISVKTRDTSSNVDQNIVYVNDKSNKFEVLRNLLNRDDFKKTLIFGQTKAGVHKLAVNLKQKGFKADSIHGDKSQSQRQRSLKLFKDGIIDILVATDVAARGLDIPNVTHVINYEVPETYEDYIHRIGRTGRGHSIGKALTFI